MKRKVQQKERRVGTVVLVPFYGINRERRRAERVRLRKLAKRDGQAEPADPWRRQVPVPAPLVNPQWRERIERIKAAKRGRAAWEQRRRRAAKERKGAVALIRQDLEPMLSSLLVSDFPAWGRKGAEG